MKWRSAVHLDDGAGLPTSAYELCAITCMCVCMCSNMLFICLYIILPLYICIGVVELL